MKKLLVLCALTGSMYGKTTDPIAGVAEMVEKARPKITEMQDKIAVAKKTKQNALAKIAPYRKWLSRLAAVAPHLPGLTNTGKLLKASANAYVHGMGLSRTFDATIDPIEANLASIQKDLDDVVGLSREIASENQKFKAQFAKVKAMFAG